MEEIAIEIDCDDVNKFEEDGAVFYELICLRNKLAQLLSALEKMGFSVKSSALELRPISPVEIDKHETDKVFLFTCALCSNPKAYWWCMKYVFNFQVTQLYETLRGNASVIQVYSNIRPNSILIRPVKLKFAAQWLFYC